MNKDQRNKIEALLVKRGFNEQGMTKGLFIIPDGRNISADVRGEKPIVGVAIAGMIHTTGHGINAVQDIQNEVEGIISQSLKSQSPVIAQEREAQPPVTQSAKSKLGAGDTLAKKGTTTAKCTDCPNIFVTTLSEATELQDKYGKILCNACRKKDGNAPQPQAKPEEKKASAKPEPKTPAKMCIACGLELSGARALECYQKDKAFTCEECEEKQNGGNKMETEIVDQKLPATKKKQELKIGTCEEIAYSYGIPPELANMFFMKMNEGLYIKNPGLLYLAAKKGYSRIEVVTIYDEKNQEWSAECRIYPKLTKDVFEGIAKLDKDLQKVAFEFATQPTNGTGRASKGSVKMITMHPFLKEMSQTRAQNRALRAFTGYGGTSYEEIPDAQLERD